LIKRYGAELPAGHVIALNGEAGYQARMLGPGWHFPIWRWRYRVVRVPVLVVQPGDIALVVAADGRAIPPGRVLARDVACDSFQGGQAFIDAGGCRGLQEEVLLAGSWNLNPWFVEVEQVPLTEIPIGYVGVVVSYVGDEHLDVSGDAFTHGDLVERGHKGVWV